MPELTWEQKFRNGMLALGLNPDDPEQVDWYLDHHPAGRKKHMLMMEEQREKGGYDGNQA